MPISSFYGLQTSLRGLLAQQRMLDTTGHNIANASTEGYSRQEATLAASPALQIPAGGVAGGAGAHLGSGVDVQGFRRIRDQFLDLQYRAQNTNLGEWTARAEALDTRRAVARRAGRQRHQRAARRSSGTPGRTSPTSPDDAAAKQALVAAGRRARRRDPHRALADGRRRRQTRARTSTTAIAGDPAARSTRSRPSSPSLNKTISALRDRRRHAERPAWTAATCCSTSSPATARSRSSSSTAAR